MSAIHFEHLTSVVNCYLIAYLSVVTFRCVSHKEQDVENGLQSFADAYQQHKHEIKKCALKSKLNVLIMLIVIYSN